MSNVRNYNNFQNIDIALFDGVGKYNVPQMVPYHLENNKIDLVAFDYASTIRNHEGVGVHFYRDDYRFEGLWKHPRGFTKMLAKFDLLLSPCYSLYTDFPLAVQLYNHYRNCWFGAYWQMLGLPVIPTVGWSDEASHEWCFDGFPVGGTVSVSSVGVMRNPEALSNFRKGYAAMLERLKPDKILFYGVLPDGIDQENIIRFDIATKQRLRERK